MFCMKCGNQLNETAVFCDKCGTPTGIKETGIANSSADGNSITYTNSEAETETLFLDMMNSIPVMQKIKENENEIEEITKQKERAEKLLGKNLGIVGKVVRGYFVLMIICVPLVLMGGSWSNGNPATGIIGTIFGAAILVGGIIGYNIFKKIQKEKIKTAENRISELNKEIQRLKTDKSIEWLPSQYRDPFAFANMFSYVLNMRVSNLKEAINLYELELHQARLEQLSAMALQNATNAATSAKVSAGFSAASAFFSLFR